MNKTCHCCGTEYVSMYAAVQKYNDSLSGGEKISKAVNVLLAEKNDYFRIPEDLEDSYVCLNHACRHIYRDFKKDISEFHAGEYREKQYNDSKKMLELKNESLRLERAAKQINLISDFLKPQSSILEVAPGRGFVLKTLANLGYSNITGVDIDNKVTLHNEQYNPGIKCITSDVLDLKENNNYDMVMGFDVLEHIEDLKIFVEKMQSLTKKYVTVQVPVDRPLIPPNYHLLKNPKPWQGSFDGHLHYFTELSIIRLFTKNDAFKCVFMYKTKPFEVAGGPELLCVFEKVENENA